MSVLSSVFCRRRLAVGRMCTGSASRRQFCSCLRRIEIASLTGVRMVPVPAESMPVVTKTMQYNEPNDDGDPNPIICKPSHLSLS